MKTKRKEMPVKNHPGIYKVFHLNESGKWVESGKYRALRRVIENGSSKKEQAIFTNFEDARGFRAGDEIKQSSGRDVHKLDLSESEGRLTFEALAEEWKSFQYLKLERSTQQTYDKLLPH